ncbi:non-hem dioxygenase in morphine synthesis N-terminal-domain-containing protein [Ochromonadaceae sp. CCMP2298]|nr:non-hem dioxygenase in morphine synthesis N-terminal-domain-containing protein [Ochromonadaceae sp. CCMP2298]
MARVLFALCLVAGAVRCAPHAPEDPYLPVIDLSVLRTVQHTAGEIVAAGAGAGFFYVSNHGVPAAVVEELVGLSREFFKLSSEEKQAIRMELSGPAWRGYFAVGAEVADLGGSGDLQLGHA